MPTYQILTNCVAEGRMESTQVTAERTTMSIDGQFIRFFDAHDAEVAVVNARHTVYVKRLP